MFKYTFISSSCGYFIGWLYVCVATSRHAYAYLFYVFFFSPLANTVHGVNTSINPHDIYI